MDFDFLLEAAAKNQAKIAENLEKSLIPDEIFKNLPEAPSLTNPKKNFETRDILEYNEKIGFRQQNLEQENN